MEADTIAAIATALGESGVGVVRVSGPEAISIADRLVVRRPLLRDAKTHSVHHAWLHDVGGEVLDEALVTVMRAPRTYTGEDVVEIGVHGGTIPARRVLRALLGAGARLADRGEFTKRAFLNGRLDLSQAEAVADVVASRTEKAASAALSRLAGGLANRTVEVEGRLLDLLARLEVNLDFNEDIVAADTSVVGETLAACDEELEELHRRAPWGRRLREGATVVLLGRPNVGKSSLFNALLEEDRALTSETPGTTRDWLEAWIDLDGVPVRLIDTAGLRDSEEHLEAEGVRRAEQQESTADLRLVVFDLSERWTHEDEEALARTEGSARILVGNKKDLPLENGCPEALARGGASETLHVSARTGSGIRRLRSAVSQRLLEGVGREPADEVLPNERHEDAIRRARESLRLARESWQRGATEELLAGDVRDAAALGEITGRTVGEEVLDRIFSQFCIGK